MNPAAVAAWVSAHTQLETGLLHSPAFAHLLRERLAATGIADELAYIALLERAPLELDRLVGALAVPETWLFRYPESFELLAEHFARILDSAPPERELRILSAGCATGEEAAAIALTAQHSGWTPDRVRIEAIDRNSELLNKAAAQLFPARSLRSDCPKWALGAFTSVGKMLTIPPEWRTAIQFRRADLLAADDCLPTGLFDAVFCRNVLIYLTPVAQSQVVSWIERHLTSDGLLFIGHAEHRAAQGSIWAACSRPHAFAYRRTTPRDDDAASMKIASMERPLPAPRQPNIEVFPTRSTNGRAAPEASRNRADEDPGWFDRALSLANHGDNAAAEELVRSGLGHDGPTAAALELLGTIQAVRGALIEARENLVKAVYLDPRREAALLQLADLCERLGDAPQAALFRQRARRVHQEQG